MNTLKAEKRNMSVKARRLRREGYVTGNLFGRKIPASIPVKMTRKDVHRLLTTEKKGSQIMLNVDGQEYDVLIKDIERNTVDGVINEIDFQALVSDEKVHSVIHVTYINTDNIVSGVFEPAINEIPYRAYPAHLVSEIKVDAGVLRINDEIKIKDLEIATDKNIELMIDPEFVLASVRAVHNKLADTDEETAETAE